MSEAQWLVLLPTHLLSKHAMQVLAASLVWSGVVAGIAAAHGQTPMQTACVIAERILMGTASVSGLLLAFRSNSATTRWNSGAKAFATVQGTSRSLLRILGTALLPVLDPAAEAHVVEFLSLIPCFSLAVLHQLEGRRVRVERDTREESPSLDDPRLLSSLLPGKFLNTLTHKRGFPWQTSDDARLTRKPEYVREAKLSQNIDKRSDLSARGKPRVDAHGHVYPSNLALDILRELQVGLNDLHRGVNGDEWGLEPAFKDAASPLGDEVPPTDHPHISLSGPLFAHSTGLLNTLSMQLTDLERLRDVTIPAILSSHLHMLLNLQLLLTPLAILPHLSPSYVVLLPLPCIVLAAATYGLHSAAERLAQPFGTSREKLPLRRWCADILREYRECVGRSSDEEV